MKFIHVIFKDLNDEIYNYFINTEILKSVIFYQNKNYITITFENNVLQGTCNWFEEYEFSTFLNLPENVIYLINIHATLQK